jgi:hypothetical protein
MLDIAPSPSPPVARQKSLALTPTFLGALRGAWLLTWRTQLMWRRLPALAITLLALPLLVYITTSSPRAWSQRASALGNPDLDFQEFHRRLIRSRFRLQPEQAVQLRQIFVEEYARAERDSTATQTPESTADRRSRELIACYERIHRRVENVLDERQFAQFQTFESRKLLDSQGRINQPVWNRSGPFYHWLIDFYFFVVLPWCCVAACGALIREELQADTLGFLMTRPLTRARLLVLKYLAQTAWLQIVVLVEASLLFTVGGLRQIPALGALLPLFLAAQFLAVLAWSALGTFLGLATKRYMAVALLYGFIVEMGIGRIPTNINTLSLMRHLKTLLAHNRALLEVYEWPVKTMHVPIGALALATVIFLSLAALLFTFKEYHHTTELQK